MMSSTERSNRPDLSSSSSEDDSAGETASVTSINNAANNSAAENSAANNSAAENSDDATPAPATFYSLDFDVRWADVDPNQHLRHSAYADYATHVRLSYLADRGWPMERFAKESVGAIILREETRYKREIELGDRINVDFRVGYMSKCGRKWTVIHHVKRGDGVVGAICTLEGMWLNLEKRRPVRPPADLFETMTRIVDEDMAAKPRRRR